VGLGRLWLSWVLVHHEEHEEHEEFSAFVSFDVNIEALYSAGVNCWC